MKKVSQRVTFTGVSVGIKMLASVILSVFFLVSCAGTPVKQISYQPEKQKAQPDPPTSNEDAEFAGAIYALSGIGKLKSGDYDGAVSDLETSVRLVPTKYKEPLGTAYAARGIFNGNKGYYTSAISDLERGISIMPSDKKRIGIKTLGIVYGMRGVSEGMNGNCESAISDLEKCIKLMPGDGDEAPFKEALDVISMGCVISELEKLRELGQFLKFLEYISQ